MLTYIAFYIIILLLVPIFDVILKNIKNTLNGKKRLPLLQTYYNLIKLFKKDNSRSQFTSTISIIAPIIILTVSIIFLFLIPIVSKGININIIVLFHLLWLSSLFLIIYALDNATYFGWLWASREIFVLAISEPIVILIILWFSIISWGNFNIVEIHNLLSNNINVITSLFIFFLWIALFVIILAENKRFPFDNPATHLELTMIHEAMLLETNWTTLAILEIASKITLIAFVNLFIYFIWTNSYWLTNNIFLFWLYLLKVLIILWCIALIEVFITKIRVFKYQNIFWFLLIILVIMSIFYFLN